MLLAVQNAPLLRHLRQHPQQTVKAIADVFARDVENTRKTLKLLEFEALVQLVTVDGVKVYELTSEGSDTVPRLDVLEGKRSLPADAVMLRHDQLERDPANPRKTFSDESIDELADAIEVMGDVLQAPLVKPTADPEIFRIKDGERRWRALGRCIERGTWAKDRPILCKLHAADDDHDHEFVALVANVQREDMSPIEEAFAIERQIAAGRRVGDLAKALGRTRRFVERRRQLLKLPEIIQIQVARGVLGSDQALREHAMVHKPAEPEAPAPQAAAGAGLNLTPAQALIMVEVSHAADKRGREGSLGPTVDLDKVFQPGKKTDALALQAEGLLAFGTQYPGSVAILRPGRDWLQSHAFPLLDADQRLRGARDDAGILSFEIEKAELENAYLTPWLNIAKPPAPPTVSDAAALVMLEVFDAYENNYSAHANGSAELREEVRTATGGFVHIWGPNYASGMFGAQLTGGYDRVLYARWPDYKDEDARKVALAEARAAVLPAKELKSLTKRGAYATPWLNGPFLPCPKWAAEQAEKARVEAERVTQRAERDEWLAGVVEAIDVFETQAPEMTPALTSTRFAELLERCGAPAPWRLPEPSAGRAYAKTAADNYCIMDSSPMARRLTIMAINIAAGIAPSHWPPAAEDADPALADHDGGPTCEECGEAVGFGELNDAGLCDSCGDDVDDPHEGCDGCGEEHPRTVLQDGLCPTCADREDHPDKACASCGAVFQASDLDDDGACEACASVAEAEADAEAASVEA